MNRRQFLQATAAAAPLIISARALGREEGPGANETVNVGIIGLGGRAKQLTDSSFSVPGMRIAAICDCFKPRVDQWMKAMPEDQSWTPYIDFREMLEKENLDGVMVETTTHARAWCAAHAMAMGMDAYIEKPMALTIAEGRELVDIARKYDRVTQIGTQQRSIPLNNWACDLVQQGAIGALKLVLAPNFVGPLMWPGKEEQPLPDGSNEGWWDVWTNQAEMRPYHHELHYGWSTWWEYDGGGRGFGVTGWGAHSYDQVQRGLGTSETGPVEVLLEEPVRHQATGAFIEREIADTETGVRYYDMAKSVQGPRARVRMTYKNGVELLCHLDGDWGPGLGCIFVGEKGAIEVNRDQISADPPELLDAPGRPDAITGHLEDYGAIAVEENIPHLENWVEGIKTRERCHADIEYGQRSSTMCYLVNIAHELGEVGKTLKWNPRKEQFGNSDEGNALLTRPRRKGYDLPT